jgi:hypothetical protein
MNYTRRKLCPFCEAPLEHLTWWADCAAQFYDEFTTESNVCNRCGFWTYSSFVEAASAASSEAFTSRIREFDITDFTAPAEGTLAWLRVHDNDRFRTHPRALERVVQHILGEYLDCELCLTKATRDGGLDLYGYDSNSGKFIVEVKRYGPKNKIDVRIVREVAGVLLRENAHKGLIITTSTFTPDARTEAGRLRSPAQSYPVDIDLLSISELLSWLDVRDSRSAYASTAQYWEEHLRKVLKGRFFGDKDFDEWQDRHKPRLQI